MLCVIPHHGYYNKFGDNWYNFIRLNPVLWVDNKKNGIEK